MAGTPEVVKKAGSGTKLPERGTLSVQMISDKSLTLKFRHNRGIYIDDLILNRIGKVQYKITVTNITQHKTVCFSAIRPRDLDNSFIISLGHIPGESTDEFDVELRVCKTGDQQELLTWGRLDSPYKLLQRKNLDPFGTFLLQILFETKHKHKTLQENIKKELDKQEAERKKITDNQERLQNLEDAERMRIQEKERIRKLAEAERLRKQVELKKQEDANRIRKLAEAERLRKQVELKKQEDAYRIRKEQIDIIRVQQAQDSFIKLRERAVACSSLAVETTEPRKVILRLKFDSSTFMRIRQEMFACSGQFPTLRFDVTASNMRTQAIRTHICTEELKSSEIKLPLPLQLKLGYEYKFVVTVNMFSSLYHKDMKIVTKEIKYKEVLLKSELEKLLQKAVEFLSCGVNNQQLPVKYAYRNKPCHYFENIRINKSNIMEVYIKDNNGDPGCPINGQINGLFFAVRTEPSTMDIPDISLFGNTRIFFPVTKLIQPTTKFYFADFYCHKKIHYITFVATNPNSPADKFCEKHLLEISLDSNPFFYRRACITFFGIESAFGCCREPRVEILYTENIDLNKDYIQWQRNVQTIGRGSSTPGGLPKRQFCTVCNLYPFSFFTSNANSF